MDLAVVVQDNAGVQNIFWVQKRLDLAHERVGLASPLALDKGCDVAPRPVLAFQRAVILVHDQRGVLIHKTCIAIDGVLAAEVLGENDVQISLERMPENDRLVIGVPSQ